MMKQEGGKWIVIIILISLMGVILFFSFDNEGKISVEKTIQIENQDEKKRSVLLENDTLELKKTGIDTLLICGKGKLNQTDFELLLKEQDINKVEVTHIILPDEITEIEYKTLCNLEYLTTIKFGKHVERIGNGALRDCPKLQYVYLPYGIKRIGPDFLYKCEQAIIITNRNRSDLPVMNNIEQNRIYSNIHSYEDIKKELSEVYFSIPWDRLPSDDPNRGETSLTLHPGYSQYGPYKELKEGDYLIYYFGNKLKDIDINDISVYDYSDGISFNPELITTADNELSYKFSITNYDAVPNIEFVLKNNSSHIIEIQELKVLNCKEISEGEAIKQWWLPNN